MAILGIDIHLNSGKDKGPVIATCQVYDRGDESEFRVLGLQVDSNTEFKFFGSAEELTDMVVALNRALNLADA
jgi:hypothetical protein